MASLAFMMAAASLTGAPHPPVHRIIVAPDGRVSTISAALRQALAGDTIVVTAGVYREPRLEVRMPLVILGEGVAVLDAGGAHEALTIKADDVTIRGLTIRNVLPSFVEDRAGIRLDGVRGCRVEGNHLVDTFFGIYAARASDCTIAGNRIEGHARRQTEAGNAIHLFSSTGFTVTGNLVRGHRDGIYLEFSPHTTIAENESRDNLRYGLHFMFSDTCDYRRNVFRRNTSGVAVMYSHRVVMTGNRFEDSWGAASYGLLLKEIKDARIEGNWITGNTVGIFAESADRMVVTDNQFVRNGWALRLMADATDGEFRHNRFAGNTFDVATNSQSSSPNTFEANYWDGYQGYDLNRDGIDGGGTFGCHGQGSQVY